MATSRPAPVHRLRPPRRLSFTRSGKYAVGMTLLVGFGAINTGNNLLYLILGMMLALILLSGLLSELVLQKLRPRRRLPERLFAGRPALLELGLRNDKPHAASYSVQLIERVAGLPVAEHPAGYVLHVEARGEVWTAATLRLPRRGEWLLEGWVLATRFPFGLFRKSRELDEPVTVTVFPPLLPAPPGDWLATLPQGEAQRGRPGRGGELYGVREHRPGDELRDVHWKLSARRGLLVSREYEQPSSPRLTLCFDNRWPGGPDDPTLRDELEQAVATCAGLAAELIARGFVLGLLCRDARVPSGSGAAQLDRLLQALARLRFAGDPSEPAELAEPTPDRAAPPPLAAPDEACLLVGHAAALAPWAGGVLVGTVPCRGSLSEALARLEAAR